MSFARGILLFLLLDYKCGLPLLIRFLLFILCFSYLSEAFPFQVNQILRTQDKNTRESTLKEQNQERLALRRRAKVAKTNLSFYIHEPIVCKNSTDQTPTDEALEVTEKSRVSLQDITNSPVKLYLFIQIIKAHLDISSTLYKSGKFVSAKSVRYHTDEELQRYPDVIVKDPVDDAFKSIYYINYVMMPLLKNFITKSEKEQMEGELSFLMNPSVDYQKYDYYQEGVFNIKKILNHAFAGHLPSYENKFSLTQIKALTAVKLLQESMQSFVNASSCPYYTRVKNVFIDPYEVELPDYHDNYVMGYGLFRRAELIFMNDIVTQKNLTYNDRVIITDAITAFRKLYPKIIRQDTMRIMPSKTLQELNKVKLLIKEKFF